MVWRANADWRPRDLDGLAVTVGAGAFFGLLAIGPRATTAFGVVDIVPPAFPRDHRDLLRLRGTEHTAERTGAHRDGPDSLRPTTLNPAHELRRIKRDTKAVVRVHDGRERDLGEKAQAVPCRRS
jgi:hypothetical protein